MVGVNLTKQSMLTTESTNLISCDKTLTTELKKLFSNI